MNEIEKQRESKGGQGGRVDEMHMIRHKKEINKLRESTRGQGRGGRVAYMMGHSFISVTPVLVRK